MKLLMIKFAPVFASVAIVVIGLLIYNRKKYFDWIRAHWFFERSFYSLIGFIMLSISFSLLLFSLMDVRGPQEQTEVAIPDQKTVIMIDTSASMLVEDVKPSRFKRSLFMAKHFVKRAIGHQVAVVLFSNIQKRIVPFTDDIDLLDARISGLETLDISRGGSNIARAIQESLQYFRSSHFDAREISGNILVFSDSEETSAPFDVDIPKKVNVAFVGVGTLNGGKIPLRGRNGYFRGYKRHGSEDVVSRLNENYIKNLGSQISSYKYWVTSSYTIYTDEILKFFERSFLEELESAHQMVVRPVWSHYVVSAGIVFYILSVVFSQFRSFTKIVMVFLLVMVGKSDSGLVWADIPTDLERLKKGRLDKIQRLKLAEKFLKKGEKGKALKLYRENVGGYEDIDFATLSNYSVALFQSGRVEEGVRVYEHLYENASLGDAEKDALRSNLLKALEERDKQQEQKKSGEGEREEKKSGGGGEEPKEGEEARNEGGNEQKDEQGKEQKGQDKSSPKKKNLTGREALMEKKKNVEKQRKRVEIPETLKSIVDKERSLQDRAFDTSTYDKKRDRRVKDW